MDFRLGTDEPPSTNLSNHQSLVKQLCWEPGWSRLKCRGHFNVAVNSVKLCTSTSKVATIIKYSWFYVCLLFVWNVIALMSFWFPFQMIFALLNTSVKSASIENNVPMLYCLFAIWNLIAFKYFWLIFPPLSRHVKPCVLQRLSVYFCPTGREK